MTSQEIVHMLVQLPPDQQLMVLEQWMRTLQMTQLPQQQQAMSLQRSILNTSDRPPSDQEVEEEYTDYLIAKYLGDASSE